MIGLRLKDRWETASDTEEYHLEHIAHFANEHALETRKISICNILSNFLNKIYCKITFLMSILLKRLKVMTVISLIIGFIVGYVFCSYVITPNVISGFEQKIHKLEEQITSLQNKSNSQDLVINDLQGRMMEKDREIDRLQSRVNNIIGQLVSLRSNMSEEKQKVIALNSAIARLKTEIDMLKSQIELTNLTGYDSSLISIVQRLEVIEDLLYKLKIHIYGNEAFYLLRKKLANPGNYIAEQITSSLFSELKSSENKIQQWIGIVGETIARNTLASIINSKIPSLVWNKDRVVYQGNNEYLVSVITYFPIEINTGLPVIGTITVSRIALTINGKVNVETHSITDISVESIQIL